MSIFAEVAKELLSMFLADARLTTMTLVLVAIVAGLVAMLHAQPLLGGCALLLGCLAILVEAAVREARLRRKSDDIAPAVPSGASLRTLAAEADLPSSSRQSVGTGARRQVK